MVMMKFAVCALFGGFVAAAQPAVPSGPGRAEMEKMCTGCHELARSVAPRQDRDGWIQTMTKMSAYGMKSTDKEFATVLNYLSTNYPAPPIPPLNINTARAIELEARLSLLRSQAARLIACREKNGPFESLSDLKKVPNIDFEKIESHKSSIVF
jgi:competence protein ComEA